jgi:hypothetical protein
MQLIHMFYIYLAVGLVYGVLTLRDSIEETMKRYPQLNQVGFTKFKKFVIVFGKINAYGITAIFHLFIMSFLYPLDMITTKRGKK